MTCSVFLPVVALKCSVGVPVWGMSLDRTGEAPSVTPRRPLLHPSLDLSAIHLMATRTQIQTLFLSYYGRPADPAAIAGFQPIGEQQIVPTLVGKVPYDASASSSNAEWIYDSVEPFRLETISQDLSGYITQIYGYLFDRLPGQVEIDNWVGALNDGLVNIDYLPLTIANAALNFDGSSNPAAQAMADVVLRKIEAAEAFTAAIADDNQGLYASWLAIDVGQQFNASINADSSDADIAEAVGFAFNRLQPAGVNVEISLADTTVAEGAVTGFALTGFGPDAAGSTYDYVLVGSEGFGVGDLVNGNLTGVVTLDSTGTGVVQIEIANDGVDPGESFVVNVSAAPGIVISSEAITIVDGPAPAPSIAVNAAQTAVNEGGTMVFEILTTNVAEGSSILYQLEGVDSADVSNAPLIGQVAVDANGLARVEFLVSEDLSFEGAETATLTASTGLGGVSDSASVVINDTSVPVLQSLQVQAGSESATEGDSLEFVITTTGLEPGTTVAYVLTGVDSADVNNAPLAGTVQVDSAGLAFIGYQVSADLAFDGTKTATLTANAVGVDPASASTVISNELDTFATLTLQTDTVVAPAVGNFVIAGTSQDGISTLGQNDLIDATAADFSTLEVGVSNDFVLENWQTINVDQFAIFANTSGFLGYVDMSGAGRLEGFAVDPNAAFSAIGVYQSDYLDIEFDDIQSAEVNGNAVTIVLDDVSTNFEFNFDSNALAGDQDQIDIILIESPIDGEIDPALFPDFASAIDFTQGRFDVDADIEALTLTSIGATDNTLQQLSVGHSLLALTIFGDANLNLVGDLGVQPDPEFTAGYLSNDNHLLELIDADELFANLHLDYTSHVGNEGNSRGENLVEVFGARGENDLFLDADGNPTNFNVLIEDQIPGQADDDVVTGFGDDTIVTDGGDDFVDSDGGNNSISTETGNDEVLTGFGDDTINTGSDDDFVSSLGGDNLIDLGTGNDEAYTGDGDDTVLGRSGDNTICVEDGDNSVVAENGDNEIGAGFGDDTITVGDGDNTINAGSGDNQVEAGDGDNLINATFGDDTITVGNGDNIIAAGAGDNQVISGSGADLIQVGEGSQVVIAGYGDDNIFMTLDDLNSSDSISGDEVVIFDIDNGTNDVLNFIEGGKLGVSEQAGVRNIEGYALHNFANGFGLFGGELNSVVVNEFVCGELLNSVENTTVQDYHIVLSNSVVSKSNDIEEFNLLDDVQRFTVDASVNNGPSGLGSAVTLDLTELEPSTNLFVARTGITYLGQDDIVQGENLELILINEPLLSETLEIDFGAEDVVVYDCSFPDAGERITPIGLQTNFIQLELQESTYVVTQEDLVNIENSDRFILSAAKAIASGSIIQAPTFSIELSREFLEAQMTTTSTVAEDFVITPDGSLFSGIEGTVLELYIDTDAPFDGSLDGGRLIVETSGNFEVNYFDLNTREPIGFANLPNYVEQQSVLFFTDNFDQLIGNDCENEFFAFKNTDLENKDIADGRGGFDTINFEFGTGAAYGEVVLECETDPLEYEAPDWTALCFGPFVQTFGVNVDIDLENAEIFGGRTLLQQLNGVSIQNIEEYVFDPFNQDAVRFVGFGYNGDPEFAPGQLDLGSLDVLRTAPAPGSDYVPDVNPNSGDDFLYLDDIYNTVDSSGVMAHSDFVNDGFDLTTFTEDGDDVVLAGEFGEFTGRSGDEFGFGFSPTYGELGSNFIDVGEGNNQVVILEGNPFFGFNRAQQQVVVAEDGNNEIFIDIMGGPNGEIGGEDNATVDVGDGDNCIEVTADNAFVFAGSGDNLIDVDAYFANAEENPEPSIVINVASEEDSVNAIEYGLLAPGYEVPPHFYQRPFGDGDAEILINTGLGQDSIYEDGFSAPYQDVNGANPFNNGRLWAEINDQGGNNSLVLRNDFNHYVNFFGEGDNDVTIYDFNGEYEGGEHVLYFYEDGDNNVIHEDDSNSDDVARSGLRVGFVGDGVNQVVSEAGNISVAFLGANDQSDTENYNRLIIGETDAWGEPLPDDYIGGYFDSIFGGSSSTGDINHTELYFRIGQDTDLAPWLVTLEYEAPFNFDEFETGEIGQIVGGPEDINPIMSYVDEIAVGFAEDNITLRLANTVAAQVNGGLDMNDAGTIRVDVDAFTADVLAPDLDPDDYTYEDAVVDTIVSAGDTENRLVGGTTPYFNVNQVLDIEVCNFITEYDCFELPLPLQDASGVEVSVPGFGFFDPSGVLRPDASGEFRFFDASGEGDFADAAVSYVGAYAQPRATQDLDALIDLSLPTSDPENRQDILKYTNWVSSIDTFLPTPCYEVDASGNARGLHDYSEFVAFRDASGNPVAPDASGATPTLEYEERQLQAITLNSLVRGIFFDDSNDVIGMNSGENLGAGAIGGSAPDIFTTEFGLAYPEEQFSDEANELRSGSFGFVSLQGNGGGDTFNLHVGDFVDIDSLQNKFAPFNDDYVELIRYTTALDGSEQGGVGAGGNGQAVGFDVINNFDAGTIFFSPLLNPAEIANPEAGEEFFTGPVYPLDLISRFADGNFDIPFFPGLFIEVEQPFNDVVKIAPSGQSIIEPFLDIERPLEPTPAYGIVDITGDKIVIEGTLAAGMSGNNGNFVIDAFAVNTGVNFQVQEAVFITNNVGATDEQITNYSYVADAVNNLAGGVTAGANDGGLVVIQGANSSAVWYFVEDQDPSDPNGINPENAKVQNSELRLLSVVDVSNLYADDFLVRPSEITDNVTIGYANVDFLATDDDFKQADGLHTVEIPGVFPGPLPSFIDPNITII